MSKNGNARLRRCMIVDGRLQRKLIIAFTWPAAACLALTAVVAGVFAVRIGQAAEEANVVLEGVNGLFFMALVLLFATATLSVFNGVKYSQRVAGPLHRIATTLKSVRAGHLTARVRLRDTDFMTGIADDLNYFLEWLEEHPPHGVEIDTDVTPQATVDEESEAAPEADVAESTEDTNSAAS